MNWRKEWHRAKWQRTILGIWSMYGVQWQGAEGVCAAGVSGEECELPGPDEEVVVFEVRT
ncbi:MAG: hypothetical protein K2M16_00045 [Muribaculaceae bacterium]|nr:hypothetical protein [Muribaculaceae bacterium]